MRLLVTGGAGYIGAVVTRRLQAAGHETVVLDDLSTGHREAAGERDLVVGDFGDRRLVGDLLAARRIEGVVHLAGSALVGESVADPAPYYHNNLVRSLALVDVVRERGVGRFVFSSTAAVYGDPVALPMDEEHPLRPTNPYGETKLAFERALGWYHAAYGLTSVTLRYFNAAGATIDGTLGEVHDPERHLIPRVLRAAAGGEPVPVFGTDYPTRDGSAVRDYVHVEDLAEAHALALSRPLPAGAAPVLNLGNDAGFSVLEVIERARRVTGRPIPTRAAPRRPGDPPGLVASSARARRELGWSPRSSGLETLLESAWKFLLSHPHGYRS